MKNLLQKFIAITASLIIGAYNIVSVSAAVIVQNSNYVGIYDSNKNPDGYIYVRTESFILHAYYDSTYKAYVRGSTQTCSMTNSNFSATFSSISTCTSDGTYQTRTISNYVATGSVDVTTSWNVFHPIDQITISSDNNPSEKYIFIP